MKRRQAKKILKRLDNSNLGYTRGQCERAAKKLHLWLYWGPSIDQKSVYQEYWDMASAKANAELVAQEDARVFEILNRIVFAEEAMEVVINEA